MLNCILLTLATAENIQGSADSQTDNCSKQTSNFFFSRKTWFLRPYWTCCCPIRSEIFAQENKT